MKLFFAVLTIIWIISYKYKLFMVLLDLGDCYADFRFFPLTTFLYLFTTASAYDSLISTPTAIPTPHILHMPQHDSYLSYNQKGWFSVPPPSYLHCAAECCYWPRQILPKRIGHINKFSGDFSSSNTYYYLLSPHMSLLGVSLLLSVLFL